jgi:cell wall-associated NlpC family hydrolase
VLTAGCGEDRAEQAPPRLAAWSFPEELFIPRVDAVAAEPEPGPERARKPASPGSDVSPGAPTDDEVRAELRALYGTDEGLSRSVALGGGQAVAPPDAPGTVQRIVEAANQAAKLPYVYGGGHGRAEGLFVDSAYDCSGSISFALANAGLVDSPMTSGQFMRWGEPGQGEWVTIYANEGHAFMVVGGARFDTVGLRQTGSRWQRPFRSVRGFVAVHPPGL